MSIVDKSYMLELAYRLSVLLNIAAHKFETISWRESWNAETLACAQKLRESLSFSIGGNDASERALINDINLIVTGLSHGYAGLSGYEESQDVQAYQHLFDLARRITHAPAFAELGFSEFFILGQQLSRCDLRGHFSTVDEPDLPEKFTSFPPFSVSSSEHFHLSWPDWPVEADFNDTLIRYALNRQKLGSTGAFSAGPLLSFTQLVICPSSFPSTLWCWQDWEGHQPWHLFMVGAAVPTSALVTVKDGNDKAFVALLERMKDDKNAGHAVDACGWIRRNELWPEMTNSNTRSKAWRKLTKQTLSTLGEFESKGGVGQYKGTGGPCRAPAALAGPECRIFIEKLK